MAQIAVAQDSTLPRDRIVNTLHFNVHNWTPVTPATDWNTLAQDLANIWNTWPAWSASREVDVRLYDMDDAKPRPIKGRATNNPGLSPASDAPREVAICLSFYAGRNLPRQRGRIYVPGRWFGSLSARPGSSDRSSLLDKADALSALGGVNVDWCVYSRLDNVHRKVTNAWVDDEYDTVRSRGLRATTRSQRAVSG